MRIQESKYKMSPYMFPGETLREDELHPKVRKAKMIRGKLAGSRGKEVERAGR